MTHPDPTARPSMEEVLAHPWLASSLPAADYYGAYAHNRPFHFYTPTPAAAI